VSILPDKLGRIASLPLYDQFNLVALYWYRVKGYSLYRRMFGSFGRKSAIYPPMLIGNPRFIHIGERVTIRQGVRLEAVVLDPDNPPEIRIGNDVNIEQDVHIVAMGRIHIHDNVSITARSSLLCGTHPFFDVRSPVKIGDRLAGAGSFLEIGEGSFLGIGSIIQMNVKIGRHTIVGSCSVVKKNVPDYCVVEGNPAVVVLAYNHEEDRWQPPAKNREASPVLR
jgi:acetyltransferase-like isoleucine patch superfamily enzyme